MQQRLFSVEKSQLCGNIVIPPSKSQTLRALIFASLGMGKSTIHSPIISPDANAMIEACRSFGAFITQASNGTITVEGTSGKILERDVTINAGNSGIVLRMAAALSGLSRRITTITGDKSLQQRPMEALLSGLNQLGVATSSPLAKGYAPVTIQGPMISGKTSLCGRDSQPISSLLIAGAFAPHPMEIEVQHPGEIPWVVLTLSWFDRLGIPYSRDNYNRYHLFGKSRYPGFSYTVPGDCSSAAFPVAAALVTRSEITLDNIDLIDCQGDRLLFTLLEKMGAHFDYAPQQKTLTVLKSGELRSIECDLNDAVDALPALSVVACFATGTTVIKNVAVARQKESNRLMAMVTELTKMGASIQETEDGLLIRGCPLHGASLNSHGDHRIAMALAVAALGANGKSTINGFECIDKTFSSFPVAMRALGATIAEVT